MSRILLSLIFVAALLLVAPIEASALSCAPNDTKLEYKSADVVFEGTVISAEKDLLSDATTYTFDVIRVWKGDVGSEIVLGQGEGEMIWGYSFEDGETYTVMAFEDGEDYKLPLCGLSFMEPYDDDPVYEEFIDLYGDGTNGENGQQVEVKGDLQWINLAGFVLLSTATLGLLVIFLARNRKVR